MVKMALVAVNDYNRFITEYLGIARIDAYLKQHDINVEMFYLEMTKDINIEELVKEIPEEFNLIGFCIFSTNAKIIYEMARLLKQRNKDNLIFAGGYLATTAYDFILENCPYIDFTVMGDGEETTYKIVMEYEKGVREFSHLDHVKTRTDYFAKLPGMVDIKKMPYPSRIINMHNQKYRFLSARLSASKGCTAHCSFCCVSNVYDKWNGREIEDIYNEVIYLYKEYGLRSFLFTDSSFEDPGKLGKKRVEQFCRLIIDYPVKFQFWCCIKASSFAEDDIWLINLMKQAGFSQVFIGIEADNEFDLRIFDKKATIEENHRAYRLFSDAGIEPAIGFIIINPFSTMENIRANYKFLTDYKIPELNLYANYLQIYYSTNIYKKVKENNLLMEDYSYINTDRYNFVNKDVETLSKFIKEEILPLDIYEIDLEYHYFVTTWYVIKALFPEEIIEYDISYTELKDELANKIKEFFDILYIEGNIEKARKQIPKFTKEMKGIYVKLNIFKMKVLKNKNFRDYIVSATLPLHQLKNIY